MDSMSGMDHDSMAGNMTMSMNMFFDAGLPAMPLWFESWMPTTAGSTFGACVGLLALTVLYRLLGAIKVQAERAWSGLSEEHLRREFEGIVEDEDGVKVATTEVGSGREQQQRGPRKASAAKAARQAILGDCAGPFVWSHEITRGILTTVHVGIGYFLMLAVMSFNAWFFIAILVGTFIGEVAFGRFGIGAVAAHHH